MTQLSHETKAQRKRFLRVQRRRIAWYNRTMPDSDCTIDIRPAPSPSSPEEARLATIAAIERAIDAHGLHCDLNHIDVSGVTDFSAMFLHSSFNGDISRWDVSRGETFECMFSNSEFNGDISNWNTARARDMASMFSRSVFQGDISRWDVSNVQSMRAMFMLSQFNGDISRWNVSNVTQFQYMFEDSKFNSDIGAWNVEKAEVMKSMFTRSAFNRPLNLWKPRQCSMVQDMFARSKFKQDIAMWPLPTPLGAQGMFRHNTAGRKALSITPWVVGMHLDDDLKFKDPLWNQAVDSYNSLAAGLGLDKANELQDVIDMHAALVSKVPQVNLPALNTDEPARGPFDFD